MPDKVTLPHLVVMHRELSPSSLDNYKMLGFVNLIHKLSWFDFSLDSPVFLRLHKT